MQKHALTGKRIIITRSEEQAGELVAELRTLGAEPLVCPAVAFTPPADTAPLDDALAHLDAFDWLVFTSANAVRFTLDRLTFTSTNPAALAEIQVAAVGPATAKALAKRGVAPALVARTARVKGLLAELGDVRGLRIVVPCADIAGDELADGLRRQGATTTLVTAYRTVSGPGIDTIIGRLREEAADVIVFASPSAVHYLLAGIDTSDTSRALLHAVTLVCIGPTTAAAVVEAGLPLAATATQPTTEGVIAALAHVFG